jgi:hypothetical protein
LLGANVPDYYRGVFPAGKETWFNPTQVGIGLGASQGLAGGVVVGGFLVLADAWLLSRRMIHSVADRS